MITTTTILMVHKDKESLIYDNRGAENQNQQQTQTQNQNWNQQQTQTQIRMEISNRRQERECKITMMAKGFNRGQTRCGRVSETYALVCRMQR
ncbi:hypothetical protein V3C99_008020 [Haemonchus contortus]